MSNLILFLLCLGAGAVAYHYAQKKGRNPHAWFLIGFLFGVLGLLVLFVLPSKRVKAQAPGQPPVSPIPKPNFQISLLQTLDPAHSHKLWYYLDMTDNQVGPMSINALSLAWEEGKVKATTYVWHDELSDWQHFQKVLKPISG